MLPSGADGEQLVGSVDGSLNKHLGERMAGQEISEPGSGPAWLCGRGRGNWMDMAGWIKSRRSEVLAEWMGAMDDHCWGPSMVAIVDTE